jgi:broad specificity phosphatase PhoE
VILVRHAMPEIVRDVPPDEWHLGAAGRAAARELADRLPHGPRVVSSDEPKARETAEEIAAVCGGSVTVDARLREAARPTAWDPDYRTNARRYLAGEALAGWEDHAAVARRVAEAAQNADIAVTHGLAITLLLGESISFWEQLRFPDAWSARTGRGFRPLGRIPARGA